MMLATTVLYSILVDAEDLKVRCAEIIVANLLLCVVLATPLTPPLRVTGASSKTRAIRNSNEHPRLALSLLSFSTTPRIEILAPKSDGLESPLQISESYRINKKAIAREEAKMS